MFSAYIGLAIAFIIIAAILLYFIIGSSAHVVIKTIMIPVVIFYGLVLLYTPEKLMGWPAYKVLPEKSIVISLIVREPTSSTEGGIYFWLVEYDLDNQSLMDKLDPRKLFEYSEKSDPRAYKLPYSRELHKELAAKEKAAGAVGGWMTLRKKKGGTMGGFAKKFVTPFDFDDVEIEIVNPITILQKDGTRTSEEDQ